VKQQASLKRSFSTLESLSPGIVVEAESIVTAGFVYMVVLILSFSQKLVIYVDGFSGYKELYLYYPM
jgi:hypothetical protein